MTTIDLEYRCSFTTWGSFSDSWVRSKSGSWRVLGNNNDLETIYFGLAKMRYYDISWISISMDSFLIFLSFEHWLSWLWPLCSCQQSQCLTHDISAGSFVHSFSHQMLPEHLLCSANYHSQGYILATSAADHIIPKLYSLKQPPTYYPLLPLIVSVSQKFRSGLAGVSLGCVIRWLNWGWRLCFQGTQSHGCKMAWLLVRSCIPLHVCPPQGCLMSP